MSGALLCWRCRTQVEATDDVCPDCNVALRPAAPATQPVVSTVAVGAEPESVAAVCPHGWPRAGGMQCRRCNEEATLELVFPWGALGVPPGTDIVIGRDREASPVAEDIRREPRFTNISRRHLRLRVDQDGVVTVTDLDSTSGTWIDSRELAPSRDEILPVGASLRLASDPSLIVRLAIRERGDDR